MTESVVSLVVDNLVSFLVQEAKLLKGVSKEVNFVKGELDSIRIFLREADARAETDDQLKIWVKQVWQVAFRMEDVLDEFRLRIAQQSLHRGSYGWVCKTFGVVKHLKPRHSMATEMQEIKTELVEICNRKERYGFRYSDPSESEQGGGSNSDIIAARRDDALYVEESELVGIEKHRNHLMSWLVDGEERRMVFAVVGTGGVGKTTVVRKAYQNDRVIRHFQCHAWLTVSRSFKTDELLVNLIKQFHESRKESIPQGVDTMHKTRLIDQLRDYLRQKRYVVFLDDVWDIGLWDSLKHALSDNHSGSRIMVTTRAHDIASSFVESNTHVYKLDPLSKQDALDLFYKKTFKFDFGGLCPPELKEYSKKIVKRSGGLPLAIVAIAGILLTKEKSVLEWKKFHDSLSSKLGEDPKLATIMKIISLSYHDLPYYLKPCFLYFGIYPEDMELLNTYLVSLWIAEGFVKHKKGQTLEEVGQDYLDHLVSRSLVQVNQRKSFDMFKVHDLMHEFILSRMEEENFCKVVDGTNTASSHESSRRLSIQTNAGGESIMENTNSLSLIRSFFMFRLSKLPNSLMHTLLSSSMHLRILDLENMPLENFPNEITNLFHLRYLNLDGTRIRVLPNTLSRLQNLEELHLFKTQVVDLPLAILKLLKLQVIRAANESTGSVMIPSGIGCLTALRTLANVDATQSETIITELGKLTQLRLLTVENIKIQSVANLCTSISKMNLLLQLDVFSLEDEILEMQFVSSPPSLLQHLTVKGRLEMLPDWIPSLSHLIKINLVHSRLMHDPIKVFQGFPNLRHIGLFENAYYGEELHIVAGGFHKLKSLFLSGLHRLHSVTIEKDALPVLIEIAIRKCEQLKQVPKGIEQVTSLKYLEIKYMPEDFTQRLSQDGGEDYWKVKHVPKVLLL